MSSGYIHASSTDMTANEAMKKLAEQAAVYKLKTRSDDLYVFSDKVPVFVCPAYEPPERVPVLCLYHLIYLISHGNG